MTAARLSPAELVAALRNSLPHTVHPVYVPSVREADPTRPSASACPECQYLGYPCPAHEDEPNFGEVA